MAFGLTDAGLEIPRLADIQLEIEQTIRARLGSAINTLPETVLGQLIGIFAERESLIWEGMEDVYNSAYPDTASGISLDNVVAITGITRQGALPSRVVQYRLFGSAGTLIPLGTQFSVNGNPTAQFASDSDVTLVAGLDEVQEIDFSLVPTSGTWRLNWRGQDTTSLAFNANAATVQAALVALPFGTGITVSGDYTSGFTVTFAGAAGKQIQPTIVLDSSTLVNMVTPITVTISVTTEGVNQGIVDLTAIATGPTQAPAGTLTVIDTPVSGLTAGINIADAVLGRNVETDEELRLRRARTLQVAGKATVDAIRSTMLSLSGVSDVIVFENDSWVVDSDGRPPKSYEVVVNGGDDQEIFDAIWDTKPAGIATVGSETGTITDSQGLTHLVYFSRPTQVPIWVELDLSVDVTFPVNGIAAAKQAITDRGNEFGIGSDVIVIPKLIAILDTIQGITDVVIRVGIAPSPTTDTNIAIDPNEIPTFDTARVGVTII